MKKLLLTALMITVAACQSDTKNLERKLDDQTKAIAALSAKLDRIQGGGGAAAGQRAAREEAAPDAVFAVDVASNMKKGMIEGPATALVTIVEAWDFA